MHNFKLIELSQETVIRKMDIVYNNLPSSAKINDSFGFQFQSLHISDEFQYIYAADEKPRILKSHCSLWWLRSQLYQIKSEKWRLFAKAYQSASRYKMEVSFCYNCYLLCNSPEWCSAWMHRKTNYISITEESFNQVFCIWLRIETLPRQFVYVPCTDLQNTW